MGDDSDLPDDDWATIVANVPIVSVDLVVRHAGGILLGKRRNKPLAGEWFVPGGTVFKNERFDEAAHRVARQELGTDVIVRGRLSTYEHFYETADVPGVDGKHYVATAFEARLNDGGVDPDDQHAEIRVFRPPFPELHPYVERYLDEVGVLERTPAPPEDQSR